MPPARARKRIEGLTPIPSAELVSVPDSPIAEYNRRERRRWAMLIKKVYQTDPLMCPRCGGVMRIISFIEARQGDIVRKILEHCGLWEDPVRGPPVLPFKTNPARVAPEPDPDSRVTYLIDPDFLEYTRREQAGESAGSRRTELTYQSDPDFLEHIRREEATESSGQLSLPWDD